MQIINRKSYLLFICISIINSPAWVAADPGVHKKIDEIKRVMPPPMTHTDLGCTQQMEQQPHIKLMAKTKQQDQYGTLNLGCIPVITKTQALLDANVTQALEDTVAYLTNRSSVIRLYIDIVGSDSKDKTLQTRYRKQAFAIKQYLTEKGVYAHLKNTRKKHFSSVLPDKEKRKNIKHVAKKTKKTAVKIKTKPNPPDPSKNYAYHMDKNQRMPGHASITQYKNQKINRFEFIPLESIYFPHNQDQLTRRAKTTLDEAAEYIMNSRQTTKVIIEAHADHTANTKDSYQLTDRRAQKVKDHLLNRGVPIALLEISSRGKTTPVDENWTRSGQARNRRVTLYIITQIALIHESLREK
ncbi:MAG: OmpA family protein [Gammaproteobacteria bacterium]|nr:OmpA family protein [Gammaproteobacteria bacterium]